MRKSFIKIGLVCVAMSGAKTSDAQRVLMQGWYWDYPKTATGNSWADTLRLKAASLAQAGITDIWFPPHAVAAAGPESNGYDPKDLFIGNTTTGLGTRGALDSMLATFSAQGIRPVADLVFNHRDGGLPEVNPIVKEYITHQYTAAKEPYPSDRFRCILPLGGNSGNGAGDYYFKISSKSQDPRFYNYGYKVYMATNVTGWQNQPDAFEVEPNGGGDCGELNNDIHLGINTLATIDNANCTADEFHLHLASGDFNAAGDTLYIYLNNTGSGYSDHRIYGIWCSACGADIIGQMSYQTFTDFTQMPSGRGQMNYNFFKPDSSDINATYLNGDWDQMYFFYDYDQFQPQTKDTLISYAKWNWTDLGVRGFRMDAVKHFTPSFVSSMLNNLHDAGMDPSLVVGELFDAGAGNLNNWINTVKSGMTADALAAIDPKIFDFSLRENLRKACDENGFDARNIFQGSAHDAAGMSGYNLVTFVNNHDFRDASGFSSLIHSDQELAYAYIFTNNQLGLPSIYYPDYYGYPNGSNFSYVPTGLQAVNTDLNKLMYVYKTYVNNAPAIFYLNAFNTSYASNYISGTSDKALIYQLKGANGRDVLVAINFGSTPLKVDHQINAENGAIVSGTTFYDVIGNATFPYQVVDNGGKVYFDIPARSYSVWVQSNTSLSTQLIHFSAVAQKNKTVSGQWEIANNQDVAFYEVQRKDEQERDFKTIGKVTAKSAGGEINYSLTDDNPVLNEAMLYRLKMTVKDGSVIYSDIQLVRIDNNETDIKIKENPVKGNLVLDMVSAADASLTCYIVNVKGQIIKTQNISINKGSQTSIIDVSDLIPGRYILKVDGTWTNKHISFIKQ